MCARHRGLRSRSEGRIVLTRRQTHRATHRPLVFGARHSRSRRALVLPPRVALVVMLLAAPLEVICSRGAMLRVRRELCAALLLAFERAETCAERVPPSGRAALRLEIGRGVRRRVLRLCAVAAVVA